jgi:hypothetical protein
MDGGAINVLDLSCERETGLVEGQLQAHFAANVHHRSAIIPAQLI